MAFSGRLLTDAIKDLLAVPGGLTVYVGEKKKADPGGWSGVEGASPFVPYTVIYPTPGGYFDGTLSAPFADGRPDYVITSFGSTATQAQWGSDRVFDTLTTAKPVVAGRLVQLLIPDVEGGVVRDDDVSPPIFYSPWRWRIFETSA